MDALDGQEGGVTWASPPIRLNRGSFLCGTGRIGQPMGRHYPFGQLSHS